MKIATKVCKNQKFVNDNTKISAGDRGGSDSHGGSNDLK